MFQRSPTDGRRVRIVDVQHMFYKFAFGGARALSATVTVDGVPQVVDTTLPAYTIKALHRYADYGFNPLVVCFEGANSLRSRKAYFSVMRGSSQNTPDIVYKDARSSQDRRFYEGINMTHSLLHNGGVTTLKADGYEADDLIVAAVKKAKATFPNLPIDVITGDQDLLPLVDDQVSVYIVSRRTTWAELKDLEITGYIQVTPDTYQEHIQSMTKYNKLQVPYNTILLTKLLRGDASDKIPAYPKFTPTKYNNLIDNLIEDGYDLSSLFRYGEPEAEAVYAGTGETIPMDMVKSVPENQRIIRYKEPKELTTICEVLSQYLDEDIVNHVRFVYNGINLNGAFTGLPDSFNRRPARMTAEVKGYDAASLQQQVGKLLINLPMG